MYYDVQSAPTRIVCRVHVQALFAECTYTHCLQSASTSIFACSCSKRVFQVMVLIKSRLCFGYFYLEKQAAKRKACPMFGAARKSFLCATVLTS